MKYQITRHNEVGEANHGWLQAKHYFSFASYHNPEKMGFGKLLVINDDIIEAGRGFGTHPHQDMEIITIPQFGTVRHEDSRGNKGTIQKGEVQVMSAGTGIRHSEFNHSADDDLKLFQIWIEPNKKGVEPRYGQERFNYQDKKNQWTQLISPMEQEQEKGLKIHQDAYINASFLEKNKVLSYQKKSQNNGVFVLVARGQIEFDSKVLNAKDAVAVSQASELEFKALAESELIVIEVPLTD